jgi:hypothetical protein
MVRAAGMTGLSESQASRLVILAGPHRRILVHCQLADRDEGEQWLPPGQAGRERRRELSFEGTRGDVGVQDHRPWGRIRPSPRDGTE